MLLKKMFSPSNKFYAGFNLIGKNLSDMSGIFMRSIHEPDPGIRAAQLKQLKDLHMKTHELTHKMFLELGHNFITPFDREDIHALISSLGQVATYMLAILKQVQNYSLDVIPHSTKNVANKLQELITILGVALGRLEDKNDLDAIYPLCIEVKKAADLCTSLTDAGVSRVYSDESDPVEVIKRLDHYELVYTLLGKCYTSANVIGSIIVKYS